MGKIYSVTLSVALGLLTLNGVAYAHGTEKHDKKAPVDAQMKKLHAMMPMLAVASTELVSALDKADTTAAKMQADKIQALVPDLKKSRPHKNHNQQKMFVELATSFDETMKSTVDFIDKDDLPGAKTAFKKVEAICTACHVKSRVR